MVRTVACFLALGITLGASGAPAPKGRAEPVYFATNKGDRGVYRVTAGQIESVTAEVVTVAKKEGTEVLVTIGLEAEGKLTPYAKKRVSAKGIFLLSTSGGRYDPPPCLLKLPAKPGESWCHRDQSKMTLVGEEGVEVPAGTFKALRVDTAVNADDMEYEFTSWYAPGIGVIKSVERLGDHERVTLLMEFVPAKR